MAYYVVESHDFSVDHGGRASQGVVADYKGREKIYLHVLPLSDDEIKRLAPRVDEHGNVENSRLALPRDEVWWIAVEGEAAWPNVYRPRIVSHCDLSGGGKPKPVPLSPEDLARLVKSGVKGL